MALPPLVLVGPAKAHLAESRASQPCVVVSVAAGALPLGQHSADDTLPGGGGDDVCDVQQLRRQYSVVNFELSSKPANKNLSTSVYYLACYPTVASEVSVLVALSLASLC